MSHSIPLRDAHHNLAYFGTTREREFFKYLPPIQCDLQHIGRDTPWTNINSHSSSDSSLTAFAQLGALRLDAQRAMISLFGPHEQFVLAEATRTLSLQNDADHNARDELWVGTCTVSYARSFCKAVANFPTSVKPSVDQVHVVTDLSQDDAYENHPDVIGYPNIRFLACAPIISPKGVVIGAYSILDDKPRGPLRSDHSTFLTDMARTVMNYLTKNRSRDQHVRGERMMVGLGSFLEGKGSLRTTWLDQTEEPTNTDQDVDVEGHANIQQQDKQRSDDMVATLKNGHSELPFHLDDPQALKIQSSVRLSDPPRLSSKSKPSLLRAASITSKFNGENEATFSAEQQRTRSETNKETYTTQVNETFSRAANLVRESLEVEGVVFFDANFRSQGSLLNHDKSDNESSLDGSASGGEANGSKGFTQPELSQLRAQNSGKATLNPCSILGFSTSHASSVNKEISGDGKLALSESFLAGLLRRYPRGKFFNFGEDGSISSDNTSDGVFKDFTTRGNKKFKKTRKSVLRQDAVALLNIAPESRSIVFWPVWDSHKSRWYAGALAWTRVPQRVFTFDDEMTFCLAFGNSVMAEVHRLGALLAERSKSDLLASISHELRSPLHGIFGTAELLNDTAIDALQQGFVHTITSCANTLLGSIDQLLEFSSINDLRSPHTTSSSDRSSVKPKGNLHAEDVVADFKVQLDALVEDTIESVFAGFSYNTRAPFRSASGMSLDWTKPQASWGGPKLILDIDSTSNWTFATGPGVWHVIFTNILGNALKYTQQGYIFVSLKAAPVLSTQDGDPLQSTITLTVKDTGCGMHAEFLQNGFFTAFSQEDDLLPGNGLGASIVRQSVASLQGDIQVKSQKRIGTEVAVSLTLDHAPKRTPTKQGLGNNTDTRPLASVTELVRQKSIGILGLGSSESDTALDSCLQKLCGQWLQMNVHVIARSDMQFPHCEFYIASYEYFGIGDLEIHPIIAGLGTRFTSPVIIICPTPRVAHSMFVAAQQRGESEVLEFITQPCGPRKLAKALEMCIKRQQRLTAASDGVEKRPIASRTTTHDKLERQPSPASNAGLGRQSGVESTNYLASADREEVFANPSGKLGALRKDSDSLHASSQAVFVPHDNGLATEQDGHQLSPKEVRPTILLVDDNDINLKLLVAFMKKLGCNYITAQNGQEALDSFKDNASEISIVLMDISMPVMDGLESTRHIRAFEKSVEKHERVVIVALTGLAQADIQREAIGSGMDLFVTKPVQMITIKGILKKGIESQG